MSGNEDILLDLADFLGPDRAEALVNAWLDPNPAALGELVAVFVREADDNGDPFEARLIPEAVTLCLTKRHSTPAGETRLQQVDELTGLAGDDPGRLLDAKYLAGRARWYVGGGELPAAAGLLAEARRLALDQIGLTRDTDRIAHDRALARIGQCSYYLGKICRKNFAAFQRVTEQLSGIDLASAHPSATAWADALFRATRTHGVDLGRDDLRLLAERELLGLYPKEKKQEKIAGLARLCDEGSAERLRFFNIRKHLMSDLAILYRNEQTAEDRAKARLLYDRCIESGAHYRDHHRGMCQYLASDLLRDELHEAMSAARIAASAGDEEAVRTHQNRAAELLRRGQQLCSDACASLLAHPEQGVDGLALTKAQRRHFLFAHGSTPDRPTTGHELTEAAAVQHAEINHILLGFPLVAENGMRPSDVDRSPGWGTLERALNLMLQLQADPESPSPPPIDLADFLSPGCVLAVPWQFGDNLSLQLYGCVPGTDNKGLKPVLLQEAVVSQFTSRVRPGIDVLLARERDDDYETFLDGPLRDAAFDRLAEQLEVFQVPPKGANLRRAVVVRPRSNAEWVLPLEWLAPVRSGTDEQGPALVELPEGVLWAGPGAAPLRTFQTAVPPERFAAFATDQLVSYPTDAGRQEVRVIEGVRRLVSQEGGGWAVGVRELAGAGKLVIPGECEGAIVIGHADREQRLLRQLEAADWGGCRAVALLFCVSARYQVEAGVFLRGLAGRLKERLGKEAVVIASRVPVLLQESLRLAGALLDPRRDPARPLATLVGEYLRARLTDRPVNPFKAPWVVM